MTAAAVPWVMLFLLVNLAAGLWRAWRGPTGGDRLLTTLLFGTTSVGMLMLMAEWLDVAAIRSVALLLVLLATIVTLAFFGMPEQDKTTASKRRERHDG